MQKQDHPLSCSLPPANQSSKRPSMASQERTSPTGRSGGADDVRSRTDAGNDPVPSAAPEDDFEFCILSSGGLALAGEDAADMCVADEVFSDGKLLPFRFSSATSADALLRSDSLNGSATTASTSGFSSRSVSRSGSSSSSSSGGSRSTSSTSDPAGLGNGSCPPNKGASRAAADAAVPRRRSLSSSVFYAHPSPSPRLPRRSDRPAAASAPRRSTGSAPPASWGVIRLGVVGAPEVYSTRPAEYRKAAAASARGGRRSARLDQPPIRTATKEDKTPAVGLLGAGLVCSCSPDAVAPVGSAEVAAAEARRRRKMAEEKKRAAKQRGQSTARRSRILEWLEEFSISKEKSVV